MMEWIKCSERMPELYHWVLVCNSAPGIGEPRCVNIWRWDGKEWDRIYEDSDCQTFSDIIYWMETNEVTHWMPLPKPPED